jgi:RecA/RadA recombinase
MSVLDKIKKNSSIKESAILSKSKFFLEKDFIPTAIPAINIALSGKLDGGLTPGLTMWAGPSKHFKTAFSLLMAKSYLDKYKDAALLFYDSEFGTPQSYFDSFGIDTDRVLHTPLTDIEQLKFDIMQQITSLDRDDKIIIVIDSIGNLASKKEVDDALEGKSVADMSRAKQVKSLFRMVTPHLTMKDIPMIVVNHTYKEIGLYPKDIVGGGCLVEGTKIKLADGTFKNVEDFLVGDLVKTLDGDKEVTYTWNPETLDDGEPECFEVEFEDGFKVVCSDKHKFLIDNEWVEAKDLIVGSDVSVV